MKKIVGLMAMMLLGLFVLSGQAATKNAAPAGTFKSCTFHVFSSTETNRGNKTSDVYNIKGYKKVHVTTYGETVLNNHSSLSATGSTVQVQQGPTSSGPWSPAFEETTGMPTMSRDTTKTADKELNYLRFIWTQVRKAAEVYLTIDEE